MTTFDVIVKARKILSDPRRWTKYAFKVTRQDGTQCYCALGALAAASGLQPSMITTGANGGSEAARERYFEAQRAVGKHLPEGELAVAGFNDNSTTTYEDVMRVFSNAAAAEAPTA